MNSTSGYATTYESRWRNVTLVWGAGAFTTLVALTLVQRRPIFWDETVYLGRAIALDGATAIGQWLVDSDTAPTGPLHALLNFVLSGGRGALPVPWVRLPNLVFLAGVFSLLWKTLAILRYPVGAAIAIMAVPMTWVVAGLAITEMPAMLGFAVALFAVVRMGSSPPEIALRLPQLFLLAVGIAVATTGRQNYLVTIPALAIIGLRQASDLLRIGLAILVGLLPFAALVFIWGGIVPPKLAFVGGGLKLQHAVLALSITGVVAFAIAPRFFATNWRTGLGFALCAAALNGVTGFVHFTTLTSAQKMLGSPQWMAILERGLNAGGVFIGAWFATALIGAARPPDRIMRGAVLGVLALNLGCAAVVHQFSSRYPVMALPLLTLVLAPFVNLSAFALLRWTGGAAVGFVALRSYFLYAP